MLRLKLRTLYAGRRGVVQPGNILDFENEDAEAKALILGGYAEAIEVTEDPVAMKAETRHNLEETSEQETQELDADESPPSQEDATERPARKSRRG